MAHHILVDHLERTWEPVFIHDSYACRKGKGTHAAVMRLQGFLRKVSKNGRARAYYLQLDIKDFFTSIDKAVLFSILRKKIRDKEALWLTEKIVFWDCTRSFILRDREGALKNIPPHKSIFGKSNKKGLPIGNLTSQFFANVYLNELDQFVKHTLRARFYIRYVDDLVLLSDDKDSLIRWRQDIEKFLAEKLSLGLHPNRRKLSPISNGIDFLGYITRRDYILVRRRVVNNLKARLRYFALRHCEEAAVCSLADEAISKGGIASSLPSVAPRNDEKGGIAHNNALRACIQSYLAHFKWANSYRLTQNLMKNRKGAEDPDSQGQRVVVK